MKAFFLWMERDEGWKTVLAVVYAIICIFDFIIVPSWIGIARVDIVQHLDTISSIEISTYSKDILVEGFTYQHKPFTLQNGGIFHLAFGALLTGSAVSKHGKKKETE
jgi:hypothetical protein